jgi:cytochrome b561
MSAPGWPAFDSDPLSGDRFGLPPMPEGTLGRRTRSQFGGVSNGLGAMTPIGNTASRYGLVAVALHWLMAVLLVALLALGVFMVRLPDVGFDTMKITLILYHKDLGMLALALAALRLAWRVTNALPRLVEALPEWQKVVARFVHLSFYALMLALPITGWLMSSAAGFTVSFLELFDLPDLVARDDHLFQLFIAVHKWLGYALIPLLVLHAGAALRHHFLFKDDTLRKMLLPQIGPTSLRPSSRQRTRRALAGPSP